MWNRGLSFGTITAALGLSILLSACGVIKPPKPPGPQPTPTPSATKFDALRLDRKGPVFVDAEGKPFDYREYNGCCFSEDGEPPIDWALTSKADMDRVKARGMNVVHMRLGPYRALPDSPPSLQETGSAYLEVGGKADVTQWNVKFWEYVRGLLAYGGNIGLRFELDVTDGWGCKGGSGGAGVPGYHPWRAENNAQHQDFLVDCAAGELKPGSVQEAWVRKVYSETVEFSNVIYQDGNEIDLVKQYNPNYTASAGLHLRDVEAIKKTKRHLFGSNAAEAAGLAPVDYITIHSTEAPTSADRRGTDKPVVNNEYNPDPSYSPERMKTLLCEAKRNGTYFAYWRHGQSLAQAEATWALFNKPCDDVAVPEHQFPQGVPEEAFTRIASKPKLLNIVNEVVLGLNGGNAGVHGQDPWVFMEAATAELRKRGLWAGQHVLRKTDEIAVASSCTGEWEGFHITSFATPAAVVLAKMPSEPCAGDMKDGEPVGKGCPGVNAGSYRGNWKIEPQYCQ